MDQQNQMKRSWTLDHTIFQTQERIYLKNYFQNQQSSFLKENQLKSVTGFLLTLIGTTSQPNLRYENNIDNNQSEIMAHKWYTNHGAEDLNSTRYFEVFYLMFVLSRARLRLCLPTHLSHLK